MEDLLRFMKTEEVDNVLPLFEGAVETGKIKRSTLKNWLASSFLLLMLFFLIYDTLF